MKLGYYASKIISLPWMICIHLFGLIIIFIALCIPIKGYYTATYIQRLEKITPELFQEWGTKPTEKIKVGFQIVDFMKFDVTKNEFLANGHVWFVCDLKKIPLATIENFSITRGTILEKTAPTIIKRKDGTSIVAYSIRFSFIAGMNFARFPIDDHNMYIGLVNQDLDARKILFEFEEKDFVIEQNMLSLGWKLEHSGGQAGVFTTPLPDNKKTIAPKINFLIDINKRDFRQISLILIPILIFFTIAFFSLLLEPAKTLTVTLTSIVALTGYAFVIQLMSPNSAYFMMSDYMFLLFLCVICFFFLINLYCISASQYHLSEDDINKIKGISVVLLYAVLLIVWVYITNFQNIHIWF